MPFVQGVSNYVSIMWTKAGRWDASCF